ncbi:hypothetical protein BKA64DRAFT_631669 [Cadophora sp. MPI-SDFR-AT-0126]|nr:hypothetical protein BKA64DRAFT_631669 [Leotiomycetes sp. MPI-SDFR-AT-0126]
MAAHILVFGATGPTGVDFCDAALEEGHKLTLYLRNPDKLPPKISSNSNIIVIRGTLDDVQGLQKATCTGATIFVSFAGPAAGSTGTPVTDAMKLIFPLLIENHFKRALILGTCSFTAPEDKGALKWKISTALIKIIGGSAFQEFQGLGAFLSSQDVLKIKWTLFRVPFLGNGPIAPVSATYTGTGQDGMFLTRKSIAAWVLKEMGGGSEWIGKTPLLSN